MEASDDFRDSCHIPQTLPYVVASTRQHNVGGGGIELGELLQRPKDSIFVECHWVTNPASHADADNPVRTMQCVTRSVAIRSEVAHCERDEFKGHTATVCAQRNTSDSTQNTEHLQCRVLKQ